MSPGLPSCWCLQQYEFTLGVPPGSLSPFRVPFDGFQRRCRFQQRSSEFPWSSDVLAEVFGIFFRAAKTTVEAMSSGRFALTIRS